MTPHISAKKDQIASIVIMPGDPLRAKFIAENFLEDAILVNEIRNMFAYTGTYKGKKVTVMGSGMGMPSMGIYSYELYKFYDVEKIIRVGSSGAYSSDLNLYDVVLVDSVYSESSFNFAQNGEENSTLFSTKELNDELLESAKKLNYKVIFGKVHSSDVFYHEKTGTNFLDIYKKYNCLCVDMESFALFHNAKVLGKQAACLLTISDSLVTHEQTSAIERQNSFTKMIEIALNSL